MEFSLISILIPPLPTLDMYDDAVLAGRWLRPTRAALAAAARQPILCVRVAYIWYGRLKSQI
eukprot:6201161-Pleurochrysis_carterae.AAC.4